MIIFLRIFLYFSRHLIFSIGYFCPPPSQNPAYAYGSNTNLSIKIFTSLCLLIFTSSIQKYSPLFHCQSRDIILSLPDFFYFDQIYFLSCIRFLFMIYLILISEALISELFSFPKNKPSGFSWLLENYVYCNCLCFRKSIKNI